MRGAGALLAVALVAAGPGAAAAARPKSGCRPVWDDFRDVRLGADGPVMDAPHLDLKTAYLSTNTSYLGASIKTWGDKGRGDGIWKLTFSIGRTTYYLLAARGLANPVDPESEPGYRVGIVGGPAYRANGLPEKDGFLILAPWPDGGGRHHTRATGMTVVARQAGVSAAGPDATIGDRAAAWRRC